LECSGHDVAPDDDSIALTSLSQRDCFGAEASMKRALLACALAAAATCPAMADEIVLPANTLERSGTAEFVYRLDRPATGQGTLALDWTDAYGRLVDRRELPVVLDHGTDVRLTLDLGRAVATANRLHSRLSFTDAGGDTRETETEAVFFVPPSRDGWRDYQAIMWQPHEAEGYAALKELGVSAGKTYYTTDDEFFAGMVNPLLDADLPWYVENIATDFYSAYHRWDPERPKNWRFLEVRDLYAKNPLDMRALMRDPSLSDPAWLQKIRDRLMGTVQRYAPFRPLFYNLADEPGIAQTASFWDFDFSPHSLDGMRAWLREEYGSLDALNAQWGSSFAAWDDVMPMTTREAVTRDDDNFSAWADFKAWMDVAFARAIRAGTEAVHAADPTALAAIEGMQIPGWGGYDYSLLADAVDVMELYDYGENVEIVRSLNPALVMLATSGGGGPGEAHVVWRDLLRGSRGVIFWDENYRVVGRDAGVGERGQQAADWTAKIRGGIGALLIGSARHSDPIAMLYSPASLRTQWMLEVKPQGQGWSERDVDSEYEDNPIRVSSRRFRWAIEHMGLQHRMVTPAQIEGGALLAEGYRVLLLPHAVALSPEEADEIRRFVAQGGTVVAAGEPGLFDAHSRRLPQPLLADLFPAGPAESMQATTLGTGKAIRLADDAAERGDMRPLIGPILTEQGLLPRFPVTARDGRMTDDVETYVFRNGGVTILALQRYPAGADGAEPVVLTLPAPSFVYDMLDRRPLGRADRLELALDAVEPTLLALAEAPLPAPVVTAPARLRLGDTGTIRIAPAGPSPAAFHVFHVEVTDPAGRLVRQYSGNVIADGETATHPLPLALNDQIGTWRIRVTDASSGQTVESAVEVAGR
jgi:hypothetical protein